MESMPVQQWILIFWHSVFQMMLKKVFNDIFSIECDDALRFDLNTLEVINITEFKEYHGVNVSIMGYLDRTKVPVSIDIGFGDVVYPERMKMEFPVLLYMEVPNNGVELKNAIVETFAHRGTGFDDIAAFDDDFTEDETRQGRWRAFIKKKKALMKVEFEETMQLLKELLLPIVDSIHNDNSFEQTWSKETKSWM